MATHSTIFEWEIPWTGEPGGLESTGLQRVGYDLPTKEQQPLQRPCLQIQPHGEALEVRLHHILEATMAGSGFEPRGAAPESTCLGQALPPTENRMWIPEPRDSLI